MLTATLMDETRKIESALSGVEGELEALCLLISAPGQRKTNRTAKTAPRRKERGDRWERRDERSEVNLSALEVEPLKARLSSAELAESAARAQLEPVELKRALAEVEAPLFKREFNRWAEDEMEWITETISAPEPDPLALD